MATFGVITPTIAVIVLVIALIIFGPGKLPQLGKGLGKTIKEFKEEVNIDSDDSLDTGGDN
ncbi:Sec-independent protein translocase protein TatA [tatA] [Desulfitobacterium hafniense]|uniref:Sec-independent protein translocase protein TatA n=1 Tax=Desulfitobacterium hafniense TaxID=49338 RepID=A0A098B7Z7_DESHA|nr:twin-arginine translocase TatA/TatE family subunit [Desulfitobacterium hafniense]CDX03971.1 Sec-independent protein translocase protein TatA [tatA] [Desulfitobacterium hafniense]